MPPRIGKMPCAKNIGPGRRKCTRDATIRFNVVWPSGEKQYARLCDEHAEEFRTLLRSCEGGKLKPLTCKEIAL